MTSSTSLEQGIYRADTDDAWYFKPIKSGVSPKPFYDIRCEGKPELSYVQGGDAQQGREGHSNGLQLESVTAWIAWQQQYVGTKNTWRQNLPAKI